ncbi:replicative DNA helicase [Glycomyces sp. MUSA5-2]|uniref:replicative DNA helicase n=1 Tax=Glycomyces sp. MUSA5-2 TaxID=2053002 RepID=UPI00300B2E3B
MNHETDTEATQAAAPPMTDLEAERAVLGAILLNDEVIPEVADLVGPGDFFHFAHAAVFEAAVARFNRGEKVDTVLIAAELIESGELVKVGGAPYLHDLLNAVPTAANGGYYARIVADHARRRRLDAAGIRIRQAAHTLTRDIDTVLEECDRAFADAVADTAADEATFADYFATAFESLENQGNANGVSTGFPDLDKYLGGLEPGCMYVAAGRPGMGKTLLLTDIARHFAVREGLPVLFATLEMSGEEIAKRLATAESGTPASWWKGEGTPTDEGLSQLARAAARIAEAPLDIDPNTDMTLTRLRARARKVAARHGGKLGLIVVDYLQLMKSPTKPESRQVEIAEYSRGLKKLAKDLKVPVLAAAQLNRESTNRADKIPQLSDLRESGAIEQDADVVMLLNRPDYHEHGEHERAGEADVIIAKNRSGPSGTVTLAAQLHFSRFASLAIP